MANPIGEPSNPQAPYRAASFCVNLGTLGADVPLVGYVLNNSTSGTTTAPARRIRANTAGTVKVQHPNGTTSTLTLTAGETQDVQIAKVFLAGTSATGIDVYF